MIRLLALILIVLAVWRLLVRRSRSAEVITVGWTDGAARTVGDDDPLHAQVLAIADRVAP